MGRNKDEIQIKRIGVYLMNKYEKAYDVIDTILHLMCGEKREDGYEPTHDEMVEAMDDLKKLVGKATPKE